MSSERRSLNLSPRSLANRSPGGWVCGISLSLCLLTPPLLAAQPVLEFTPQAIDVAGLTPGGDAVLFGVVRELVPWMEREVPYAVWLTDEDGDGAASFAAASDLGPKSVWTIIDLASSEVVIDGPDPDAFSTVSRSGKSAFSGFAGDLHFSASRLQVLVARAGSGAWTRVVSDGAAADLDGLDNGEIVVAMADLEPLAASGKPPTILQPGDVVIGIDTATMKISTETITAQ